MTRLAMIAAVVASGSLASAQTPAPTLDDVVTRVTAYVAAYERQFSALVAEERYVQELTTAGSSAGSGGNLSQANPGGGMGTTSGGRARRVLKSDYLIARLDDGGWMPFRDVYEVDGSKVVDRSDRLAALFLKPGADVFEQAMRIMLDSTRHNLGSTSRTISIPILGLMLLHEDVRARMDVTHDRDDVIDGRTCWVLAVKERTRPALIKTAGGDLPLTATLWVEPATGRVLRTLLMVEDEVVRGQVTTWYRDDAKVGFWVPVRMEDDYTLRQGAERIKGVATYDRFRRFTVATDENVKKPPPR